MAIYTIGHSTRELAEFTEILKTFKIGLLVDVRSVPRSRHTPQFNADNLAEALPQAGIGYIHVGSLGGLRHTVKDSVNLGWHNTSFRGYADYMQMADFAAGIDELLGLAKDKTVAIMCAEAVPWRCHRSLIGDALLIRGIEVIDIFDQHKTQPEKLTSFADVQEGRITYPEIYP
jgi:uncharacterized protein (DUF488 family)